MFRDRYAPRFLSIVWIIGILFACRILPARSFLYHPQAYRMFHVAQPRTKYALPQPLLTLTSSSRDFPSFKNMGQSSSSSSSSLIQMNMATPSTIFDQGDVVHVSVDGSNVRGVIGEQRGGGWYAVRVPSTDGSMTTIVKCRGKHLRRFEQESVASESTADSVDDGKGMQSNNSVEQHEEERRSLLSRPTIIDLDERMKNYHSTTVGGIPKSKTDRLYLEQCIHHASYTKWVIFSDLHVSPASMEMCLEVLDTAHSLALERNAGILFLGDFWHHRGTIRVDCLNAILGQIRTWQVPMILIPGNHDQVTLGLSENHGLTPLENAYRIETLDNNPNGTTLRSSVPGPLVFSQPTKFANALFVPHIRDISHMKCVLQSEEALSSSSLFVHADITGASMNDHIVSTGGVSPTDFPPNRLVYSGHFHKPHFVQNQAGRTIQYVGSPYQTSLSEAHQSKELLLVDSKQNWECVERIPIHVGRKHFRRAFSAEELRSMNNETIFFNESSLLKGVMKEGDRVVLTVDKDAIKELRRQSDQDRAIPFDAEVKALRQLGATVEIREIKAAPIALLNDSNDAELHSIEELSPEATLSSYLAGEVQREATQNSSAEMLLNAGLTFLKDLESSTCESSVSSASLTGHTKLCFESVEIQGFGPFKDSVNYPLNNRGLVLLRGVNKDGGADSNGSGKTSLAMATLWTLTGTTDPRPLQDAKVSDVVNDLSKTAKVSVRGTLNGDPFVIIRTKGASRGGGLAFHLDGKDLTTQSAKETQLMIDEKLGVGTQILARTIFHGQHAINGLLEASDVKLKEELSLIVPLSLWQDATSLARNRARAASQNASELSGMITLRTSDLNDLKRRRDVAKEAASNKQAIFTANTARVKVETTRLGASLNTNTGVDVTFDSSQSALDEANRQVEANESRLQSLRVKCDAHISKLKAEVRAISTITTASREQLQADERKFDRAELKLESALEQLKGLETKWKITLSTDHITTIDLPDICPTCLQPIVSFGEGHSHGGLQKSVEQEVETGLENVEQARGAIEKSRLAREPLLALLSLKESDEREATFKLQESSSKWNERLTNGETDLKAARECQLQCSKRVSDIANNIQQLAEIKALKASLSAEFEAVQTSEEIFQELSNNLETAEAMLRNLTHSFAAERAASTTASDLAGVFGPRGVQTFILQNAINALQSTSQAYLDELSDGSQRLEFALDAGERITRGAFVRGTDGNFIQRPLSSLSGGQWRRCSLATSLGFAELVARRGRMRSSLCVLDEPLTHLDQTGRAQVGKLLRRLLHRNDNNVGALESSGMEVTTILVVLQDLAAEELEESFDHIDQVVKEGGLSKVEIDEYS